MVDLIEYGDVALPARQVWDVIGEFGGIRKWASIVESETVESSPDGPVRVLDMGGGRLVRELQISGSEFSYGYTILDRPDLTLYRGIVSVIPLDADNCRIVLILQAESTEVGEDELTERYTKFLRGNLKAMRRAVGA